ncbi:Quinidine resistance protein 1 [Leucoagaricus sp. SymC.cos]|nr:Quinidine resistance protein 1 [Leucoagaricus sp. SymC.cos]
MAEAMLQLKPGPPEPFSREHLRQVLNSWHWAESLEHPVPFPGPLAGEDNLITWIDAVKMHAEAREIPRQQWANAILSWIPAAEGGKDGFRERLLRTMRAKRAEGEWERGRFWNWENFKDLFLKLCSSEVTKNHRAAAVGSAAALPLIGIPLLGAIGFTSTGVAGGSIAAGIQSAVYGGATGGVFSVLQSIGARAAFPAVWNLAAGAIGAGATAAATRNNTNNTIDAIMTSEETPLLSNKHDLIYERFSSRQKKFLVAIVSWGGLVAFFTSGTFVPSVPQIAKDLNSTGEVISYAVSIYILASSCGGLIGSKYSKFYGRRPSYLWCLPLMITGSFGVATARTVPQLMVWRFIQAMGASPGLSVGAGVIGDIYKLEERGAALGSYFGMGLLGLALAPTVGGVTAHYWSWRAIHYGLAAFAFGALFCIMFFFPETSHPGTRGIDEYKRSGKKHSSWRPVMLNPLSQLLMLRSPNILSVGFIGLLALLTDFTLMIPLPYTIVCPISQKSPTLSLILSSQGKRYGIENEALIGLCFIPLGIGNAIGAPLSGWISDKIVIKYKKQRGYWYPEDRLRACLFSCYLPITVLASGLITKYIPGTRGLVLNLICFFINGMGCDIAFTPCGAYVVDVLHENSAEVTAAVNALRSLTLAIAVAMLLPMINNYGHLFTNAIVSLISVSAVLLTILTITYGDAMRAWVDIGYSTAENN